MGNSFDYMFKLLFLTAITCCAISFASPPKVTTVTSSRPSVCDSCECLPDNVAPVTVNCTCTKSKLLIFREQDSALLSSVRDLTLASCGFVSLPSSGLSECTALTRVAVRDMKLFHYTAGLFPALESLSVEDVGELVLDGFGPANRTLRHLTLRRTNVNRLVKGTVTAVAPLRRVLFDQVNVDEIESGALEMVFVGDGDNVQAAAADGFTIVDSLIKSVASGGVSVRSGMLRILNSTLEDMTSGAVVVDDSKSSIRLSANRFASMVNDSVSVLQPDGPTVYVDGNKFLTLPADLQLFKSERAVEFRDNEVENVDLGRFLFDIDAGVRVTGNRFVCDCDPRRISVLKINQVFPDLMPDADSRLSQLLTDNYCLKFENTTLADYRDLLVKEIACKGTTVTTVQSPTSSQPPSRDVNDFNRGNRAVITASYAMIFTAVTVSLHPLLPIHTYLNPVFRFF
ncbi:Leucine-rich repeat domain, L domain-like [Cinara cedri]|uniref:Leucine-rich repeat domain, L domain-like n=1 Tax=Cinara cedri TaxID=506608 RepID=A0A5E4MKC9_9HEMI|nr:Leucine-rich repeat domain, L domain-like [Cinara cedri]